MEPEQAMNINSVEKTLFRLVDIEEYEVVDQLHNMYDIMVEDDCSFTIANGVISHNSALSPILEVRNPKTDGGYPLRGKVMNVRGMQPVDILKNKEIAELMSIIGLEFGKPAKNLNYGKLICFSDLDIDGAHIFGLLLNLFSHWPELFTENRIYRCLAPLYYCTKGKDIKMFYTLEEFSKFNAKGYEVQYFKGLGSMPKSVYKECLQNSVLVKVSANEEDYTKLDMFFGDNAAARKTWMIK